MLERDLKAMFITNTINLMQAFSFITIITMKRYSVSPLSLLQLLWRALSIHPNLMKASSIMDDFHYCEWCLSNACLNGLTNWMEKFECHRLLQLFGVTEKQQQLSRLLAMVCYMSRSIFGVIDFGEWFYWWYRFGKTNAIPFTVFPRSHRGSCCPHIQLN